MRKHIKSGDKVKAPNYKQGKYRNEILIVSGEKIKKNGNFVVPVVRDNGDTLWIPTDYLKYV